MSFGVTIFFSQISQFEEDELNFFWAHQIVIIKKWVLSCCAFLFLSTQISQLDEPFLFLRWTHQVVIIHFSSGSLPHKKRKMNQISQLEDSITQFFLSSNCDTSLVFYCRFQRFLDRKLLNITVWWGACSSFYRL